LWHKICIVEIKNAQKIVVGSHKWRRLFGIPLKCATLNDHSEGSVQWYAVISSSESVGSTEVGNFLTGCVLALHKGFID
jgi:hypothetical protein